MPMTIPRAAARFPLLVLVAFAAGAATAHAQQQPFKFSNEDDADKAKQEQRQEAIRAQLATPCRNKIKNQKIMVLIGESSSGRVQASQGAYRPHFEAINSRLRGLGLRTYTQAEITAQVAQAEIDAHFRNDPDAAISASKRLAAQYVLKGLITANATRNSMINVNQVNVSMNFTLTGADGRTISQASAQDASYSGADTSGMALTLINERADEVVARLYSDYCRAAGVR